MKNTRFAKLSGFTLDQTILVVAVIAVLATVIITSVAWEVLSRANSTKLNAHLQQVSDAIGSYYQDDHGSGRYTWPTKSADLAPYLAGYTIKNDNLTAPFGTSSNPSELSLDVSGKSLSTGSACGAASVDCYYTVTLTNIQAQEVKTANDAIDGEGETQKAQSGRLRWTEPSGGSSSATLVPLTYYALKK